jgi:transcription elongation factor Elf1
VQKAGVKLRVATVFDCPYCSRRDTVEVKLVKKEGIGYLGCRVCAVKYQMRLGPLTKEVDIFCNWIDNAEQLNSGKQKNFGLVNTGAEQIGGGGQLQKDLSDDSEDEMAALRAGLRESKRAAESK